MSPYTATAPSGATVYYGDDSPIDQCTCEHSRAWHEGDSECARRDCDCAGFSIDLSASREAALDVQGDDELDGEE